MFLVSFARPSVSPLRPGCVDAAVDAAVDADPPGHLTHRFAAGSRSNSKQKDVQQFRAEGAQNLLMLSAYQ